MASPTDFCVRRRPHRVALSSRNDSTVANQHHGVRGLARQRRRIAVVGVSTAAVSIFSSCHDGQHLPNNVGPTARHPVCLARQHLDQHDLRKHAPREDGASTLGDFASVSTAGDAERQSRRYAVLLSGRRNQPTRPRATGSSSITQPPVRPSRRPVAARTPSTTGGVATSARARAVQAVRRRRTTFPVRCPRARTSCSG